MNVCLIHQTMKTRFGPQIKFLKICFYFVLFILYSCVPSCTYTPIFSYTQTDALTRTYFITPWISSKNSNWEGRVRCGVQNMSTYLSICVVLWENRLVSNKLSQANYSYNDFYLQNYPLWFIFITVCIVTFIFII